MRHPVALKPIGVRAPMPGVVYPPEAALRHYVETALAQ